MKVEKKRDHYERRNIKINPLKHDFNGFLDRVEIQIEENDRVLEERGFRGPEDWDLLRKTERFYVTVVGNYRRLRPIVIRKREYYEEFTNEERMEYQKLLCKLEFYCSCILHVDLFNQHLQRLLNLSLPLSDWTRGGIWSLNYHFLTSRLEVNTLEYDLEKDKFKPPLGI